MATAGGDFTAQIGDWARQSQARALAVLKDATQTVANDIRIPKSRGGHMPVDTGNLRRSLTISKVEMPRPPTDKKREFADSSGNITLTIASLKIGETIYLGFQANYASIQENLNGFVRLTVQRWPEIVAASAKKLQGRVEGRGR